MILEDHLRLLEQQEVAPVLLEKVADANDHDDLADVCAAVETTVREECQDRDLGKHAGIACLYMVVNRLANPEEVTDGD